MAFFYTNLVRPLHHAENHFLEVLLSEFELTGHRKCARVKVSFDRNSPATWNRAGRDDVRSNIPDFEKKANHYQEKLQALLSRKRKSTWHFRDSDFVFRWASAGVLPIIRMADQEYYCLFYREIFPVGWNIANGACDNVGELLDPLRTLERELREELIILDFKNRHWYVLKRDDGYAADRPEFAAARLIVDEQRQKRHHSKVPLPIPDITGFQQIETPLKWLEGPDSAAISMGDAKHNVHQCFMNINALDFGIELDRVARINVGDGVVLCDGEIAGNRLLNRLVGLFRVDKLNRRLDRNHFVPDRFFYDGEPYPGSEFQSLMKRRFLRDIAGVRPKSEVKRYEALPTKFDLCPVTRGLVRRYHQCAAPDQPPPGKIDVFISFGRGDDKLAGQVADKIIETCGRRVFFSPRSRYEQGWDRAIDQALDSASCLVAVGSKLNRLCRRWPEYEYRTFHKDIRNGRKRSGRLISFVAGIEPVELPLPLRSYPVEFCKDSDNPAEALDRLAAKLC
ncbi:MAG TPA: TIR domain-containing protein [Bryobacteraceae bacterium]|nr:TIR domain-containing protein [Bryobacteraceae bacterium]